MCRIWSYIRDVADTAYYAEAVQWAYRTGVAGGYGDGRFGPDMPITRQQLAAMLYRYANSPEIDGDEIWREFPDASQVSDYAVDAMAWAAAEGLISGTTDGRLNPQGNATRAHVAVILMRLVLNLENVTDQLMKNPSVPPVVLLPVGLPLAVGSLRGSLGGHGSGAACRAVGRRVCHYRPGDQRKRCNGDGHCCGSVHAASPDNRRG